MKNIFCSLILTISISQLFGQSWIPGNNLIYTNGNVGIGTATPSANLEIYSSSSLSKASLKLTHQTPAGGNNADCEILFSTGGAIVQRTYPDYGNGTMYINSGANNSLVLQGGKIFFGGLPAAGSYAGTFGFNDLVWATSLIVSDFGNGAPSSVRQIPTGYKFAVNGASNFLNNVLIGVNGTGVTTPYRLDVQSPTYQVAKFMNTTGSAMISLQNSSSDVWGLTTSGAGNGLGVPSGTFYIESVGNGAKVAITKTGNLGVGTISPSEKVHVIGNVKVEGKLAAVEICANTTSSWCDYVFEPDYDLPKLTQVEAFIAKHKHLPDVPSEADVKANGYNLTKMDATLLKKLEEAYLYILDLEARVKVLEGKK